MHHFLRASRLGEFIKRKRWKEKRDIFAARGHGGGSQRQRQAFHEALTLIERTQQRGSASWVATTETCRKSRNVLNCFQREPSPHSNKSVGAIVGLTQITKRRQGRPSARGRSASPLSPSLSPASVTTLRMAKKGGGGGSKRKKKKAAAAAEVR